MGAHVELETARVSAGADAATSSSWSLSFEAQSASMSAGAAAQNLQESQTFEWNDANSFQPSKGEESQVF